IDVADPEVTGIEAISPVEYEAFLAEGDPAAAFDLPADEWDAITLNYTSGTTGDPKGVVAHHRGAYIDALNNAFIADMRRHMVYLWCVPMFHCNGWCHPWTVAAMAGTNICLRRVDPKRMFDLIRRHRVTNTSGAPIVFTMLTDAPDEWRAGITHR
ncbi:AMP-binding protein, partial [Stenotrophomonas sp. A3_2]|uniref:AMP-binding protein n=1 Tax=Stenotrophomonas sp. A3_2 TaxID=3119978 RepID=UPI002FC36BE7